MRYYSKVTDKGNSSFSDKSQANAEEKAKWLDDHDCSDCSDCSGDVIQAGTPDGWRCYGHKKDGQLLIVAGCRKKTLAEARAYWAGKNDRREVLAAVEYIASVAALKGWQT